MIAGILFSVLAFIIISLLERSIHDSHILTESKNQLHHIFDSAIDGLLTFDGHAKIESFNLACEKIFGYQKQEVAGKKIFILMPINLRDHIQSLIHRYLTTGEAEFVGQKREITGLRKNGESFEMEISVSEVNDIAPRLFSVIIRDITERKKEELEREQLIHNLKISNENLEQYAHAASHDLKEPVRSISNYLEIFNKKFGDSLEENAKRYITLSIQSAKRMNALIEGLLQYSLIDIRNMDFVSVDLNHTVKAIRSNLNLMIEKNHAEVIVDQLPTVNAVEIHMVQLFQNLLLNAIKYKSESPPRIEIQVKPLDSEWLFSVKDNGTGFDPEYKDQIFQLFKRLHTQDEVAGSGIGLALCKRIVDRHGGDIWVESTPGEGSIFYFTLPSDVTSI
jgi:PAS domain S-box-containing protein